MHTPNTFYLLLTNPQYLASTTSNAKDMRRGFTYTATRCPFQLR